MDARSPTIGDIAGMSFNGRRDVPGYSFRGAVFGVIASFFVLSTAGVAAHLIVEDGKRRRDLFIDEAIDEAIDELVTPSGKRRQVTPAGEKKKRKMIQYDRERACRCVMDDWLGPVPRFNDKQYERHFRITRTMAKSILQHLAARDKYWRISADAAHRKSMYPEVKLTMALLSS